ncbi:hypothetical protein MAH1_23790 [Sessilibacter sp. MAH1]
MIKSRAKTELSVNHERWLVSYADFITLLFAFFVVMYSISQVNQDKYQQLNQVLQAIFNQPEKSLNPIQVGDPSVSTSAAPVNSEYNSSISSDAQDDPAVLSKSNVFTNDADKSYWDALEQKLETEIFAQLDNDLKKALRDYLNSGNVSVQNGKFWYDITLKTHDYFLPSSAEPNYAAETLLDEIAKVLAVYKNPISVEGHTDNLAINSDFYPSHWELSSARAASAIEIMVQSGIDQQRLTAVGHSFQRPVVDFSSEQSSVENPRIVIRVAKRIIEEVISSDREFKRYYQQRQQILTDKNLSAREKNNRLIELTKPVGDTPLQTIRDSIDIQHKTDEGINNRDINNRYINKNNTNVFRANSSSNTSSEEINSVNDLNIIQLNDGNILITNEEPSSEITPRR